MTPRAIIVNRVSTDKQRDNLSINIQRSLHPRIASQVGAVCDKQDVFDLAVSSTTFDQHHWNGIKQAIASGRYKDGFMIIGSIDRYHRDKSEWFELMVALLRQNITVVTPDTERADFKPSEHIPVKQYNADQFKDLIQLVFYIEEAEVFKRRLIRRIKMAFSHARNNGIDISGTGAPSYGHEWDPRRTVSFGGKSYGRWVVNQTEAAVVLRVIRSGIGVGKLVQELNRNGIPTKRGKEWNTTALYRIILHPRLAGLMRDDSGQLIKAVNVEAVISESEWKAAVARIRPRNVDRSHTTRKYPLVGLVHCGHCFDEGKYSRMIRFTSAQSPDDRYSRLYCPGRKRAYGSCLNHKVKRGLNLSRLTKYIISDISQRFGNRQLIEKARSEYERKRREALSTAETDALQSDMKRIDKQIDNLVSAVADGFDRHAAVTKMNGLKAKRSDIEQRLEALLAQQSTTDLPPADALVSAYRQFSKINLASIDAASFNMIIEALINRIYYYPDRLCIDYRLFGRVDLPIPDSIHDISRKVDISELPALLESMTIPQIAKHLGVTTPAIYYRVRKLRNAS